MKGFTECCISSAMDGTEGDMLWNGSGEGGIHVPLYYRVNPNVLSLVGDALPGYRCGSPNHTCMRGI